MYITDGKQRVEVEFHEWHEDSAQWGEDFAPEFLADCNRNENGDAEVDEVDYTLDYLADIRDGVGDAYDDQQEADPNWFLFVNDVPFGPGEPVDDIPLAWDMCINDNIGQVLVMVGNMHVLRFAIGDDVHTMVMSLMHVAGLDADDARDIAEIVTKRCAGSRS